MVVNGSENGPLANGGVETRNEFGQALPNARSEHDDISTDGDSVISVTPTPRDDATSGNATPRNAQNENTLNISIISQMQHLTESFANTSFLSTNFTPQSTRRPTPRSPFSKGRRSRFDIPGPPSAKKKPLLPPVRVDPLRRPRSPIVARLQSQNTVRLTAVASALHTTLSFTT